MTREGLIEVMARAICVSEEVPADEVAYTWEDGSMLHWETYIPAATAALAAIEAAGVRLVPSEATEEMIMASSSESVSFYTIVHHSCGQGNSHSENMGIFQSAWACLLAARPYAPAPKDETK